MLRTILTAVSVSAATFIATPVLAAGPCAGTPIQNAAVDTTNGPWSCHINDNSDKVALLATANDYDDTSEPCNCFSGDRINLAATTWVASDGSLDSPTGSTNAWKAGTSIGSKTLTVTFKDLNDGADCDDDDVQVQKSLIAFKVGCNLATSVGNSVTVWETDQGGASAYGELIVDTNQIGGPTDLNSEANLNSVANWTLKVNPGGTAIKQNVHAKAHAEGHDGGTTPTLGRLYGLTADSDWDVGANGSANVRISINLGLVSLGFTFDLTGDDNLAALAAAAAFGSELHNDYSQKLELVSETTTGPSDTKTISHNPNDATMTGADGFNKQAEWEIGYKIQKKVTAGNWATGECKIEMEYIWGIVDTPWYGQ